MNTPSKTTAMFLSLFALVAIACTPGCVGTADSEGEEDFVEEGVAPGDDENVGESEGPLKGGTRGPAPSPGCPPGTWQCGYGCTSTDYTCA